ncbi:MAG: hypothetical protein J7L25_00335 [Deltaproteobacteria bacterium]|nr:hypothetical protein [Candidatus Tharpella aukensis]
MKRQRKNKKSTLKGWSWDNPYLPLPPEAAMAFGYVLKNKEKEQEQEKQKTENRKQKTENRKQKRGQTL